MTARPPADLASLPLRSKILLLVAGPSLVLAGFGLAYLVGWLAPPAPDAAQERLARWFDRELRSARRLAEEYLRAPQDRPARRAPSGLAGREEGLGVLDADGNYLVWRGTPPEPHPAVVAEGAAPWQVRLDGVHTRLVVRAGPDAEGLTALAAFVVDSRLPAQSFAALVPSALAAGLDLDVVFHDTQAVAAPRPSAEPTNRPAGRSLASPAGTLLATATLEPPPSLHRAKRARGIALAWAAAVLFAALALLFDWSRLVRGVPGLAAATGGIVIGRLALAAIRAPAWLLPRDLGTASVYGTSAPWRLAGSPGDLLLTALALYLLALALRDFCAAWRRRAWAGGLAMGGALALLVAAAWVVDSLARDSTLPLLEAPGPWSAAAAAMLVVALSLVLLAVAELSALAWERFRRAELVAGRRATRLTVAIAFLVLAVPASFGLQGITGRLALERLRSEYAPLVLEQSARRSVALSATLRRIQEALAERGNAVLPPSSHPDFPAYYFWATSELFFSGYKSSIDFYDAGGALVSHFGFDLPLLDEAIAVDPDEPLELRIETEFFEPVASVQQKLRHAEMPLSGGAGGPPGKVVGHVLDEPDNLAFLPGSQPYLAALGPGAPHGAGRLQSDVPRYVLYDAPGTVLLSTLDQPPAMADALVQSFDAGGTVRLEAGDEPYVGLAIQDDEYRLHLLLVPARTPLERLAAAVRLGLVGTALLALLALLPLLARPSRLLALPRALGGSFYRKLLAALLLASMVPLVGLALFLRGYVLSRGEVELIDAATRYAGSAQRVLNDYAATQRRAVEGGAVPLNDEIVYWLRSVIGQEIHVYQNGLLQATSKRELFTAGLLAPRLDGEVQRLLGREGFPFLVVPSRIGPNTIPVAYAPVQSGDPLRGLVVAVPVVARQQQIARAVNRVAEMILLSTVALAGLLAIVAAYVARTVARPVRELVGATGRIAAGDYDTRLESRTRDEVAELVRGFNSMATSLAAQRADLERRREYMELLLRHATTGVLSTDVDGCIVTLNPAARALLSTPGRRPRVGQPLVSFLAGSAELEPVARLLERPAARLGEPEEIDLARDGGPHRLRLVRVDLPDPQGGHVGRLILLDDVTDLMKSNQLAAWAEMARAIAHEIKNPLTPIQLSTEHLQRLLRDRQLLPAPELEACLETVKKQVRTLYDIAGEFSAYAKLPSLAPQPTDPVAFMRETAGPYRTAAPPELTIEERYEAVGAVDIDGKVLGRAVINLIENALQAMPHGGRLRLAVTGDAGRDEVVLSVEDSGIGLDPEVRRRLFEPYFSTKSSGTGLGLAIVRRAVEAHHGRIEVDSAEGRGTTFRIHLPRSSKGRPRTAAASPA